LLEFRNVRFGYDTHEILHHVSFKLERGKTYALVGPTGGGKTTTASLIARLYDPREGTVLLDGKDIRSYTRRGAEPKDRFYFAGTVPVFQARSGKISCMATQLKSIPMKSWNR
jgi:ATP-binding cassette subfamily B protein